MSKKQTIPIWWQYGTPSDPQLPLPRPWTNSAGWLQGDPCDTPWAGVVCRFHRVVALQLAANNLRGPLPASIGALPFLEHLDVSSNGLTGPGAGWLR